MHKLLSSYLEAKEPTGKPKCACCSNVFDKKRTDHAFCTTICKDRFWLRVKGSINIAPIYPGGYDSWKKDLRDELERRATEAIEKELSE